MKTQKLPGMNYGSIALLILILLVLSGCGPVEAGVFEPAAADPSTRETEPPAIVKGEIGAVEVGIEPTPIRRTIDEAGKIISTQLVKKNPVKMQSPLPSFDEILDEDVWEKLQAQLFVVTDGIYKNETFLLRYDQVVQLGTALGGQGLISKVVSDLDQDGQPELIFTYSAGLSPKFGSETQTRVGMVDVTDMGVNVTEANMAYLGTAALTTERTTIMSLNDAEFDENTGELHYKEVLGQLFVENSDTKASLAFRVDPNLSRDTMQKILSSE